MKVIVEDKHIYWDNDKKKWYFDNSDDYEKKQSLADYTKQVRKEVCENIRKYIPKCSGMDMVIILDDTHTLNTILDQIQGE